MWLQLSKSSTWVERGTRTSLEVVDSTRQKFCGNRNKDMMGTRQSSPSVTVIPPLRQTISTITQSQHENITNYPRDPLAQAVQANIRAGWIIVVLPDNTFLNSWERVGLKILLHLNDGNGAYTATVPSTPGLYRLV